MRTVRVHLTPGAEPVPRDSTAVILDVLRATTTLTHALANGARAILPAGTPEEARALQRAHPGALLCGERDGRILPGFDLGNSPAEYTPGVVSGKTLVFASTNGSIAMLAARGARRRLLGAFVNAGAVVEAVARDAAVVIVCSGKLGRFSLEDAACAGWLVRALERRGCAADGASARLARALAPAGPDDVLPLLEGASHGRYLRQLGGEFLRDLPRCAAVDSLPRVFAI
jgi:2-phosphosulfolactate phosphatase